MDYRTRGGHGGGTEGGIRSARGTGQMEQHGLGQEGMTSEEKDLRDQGDEGGEPGRLHQGPAASSCCTRLRSILPPSIVLSSPSLPLPSFAPSAKPHLLPLSVQESGREKCCTVDSCVLRGLSCVDSSKRSLLTLPIWRRRHFLLKLPSDPLPLPVPHEQSPSAPGSTLLS